MNVGLDVRKSVMVNSLLKTLASRRGRLEVQAGEDYLDATMLLIDAEDETMLDLKGISFTERVDASVIFKTGKMEEGIYTKSQHMDFDHKAREYFDSFVHTVRSEAIKVTEEKAQEVAEILQAVSRVSTSMREMFVEFEETLYVRASWYTVERARLILHTLRILSSKTPTGEVEYRLEHLSTTRETSEHVGLKKADVLHILETTM